MPGPDGLKETGPFDAPPALAQARPCNLDKRKGAWSGMGRTALSLLFGIVAVSSAAAQQSEPQQNPQVTPPPPPPPGKVVTAGYTLSEYAPSEFPVGDDRPTQTISRKRPPPDADRVRVDTGGRVASQHISRGIGISNKASVQPYITLTVGLPELAGGPIQDVDWFIGSWNSWREGGPGLGQPNRGALAGWYEADFYTGVALGLPNDLRLAFAYYYYHSPSHSFDGYSDLEWILSYDDTGRWEGIVPLRDFTLAPALRVTHEVGRPGREDALYVQPSVMASFNISRTDNPIWIRVPLAVGLSDSYYRGKNGGTVTFGYFRTGLTLAGAPFKLGKYPFRIGVGVDVWVLNDKVNNSLDDTEVVGWAGFRWAF